jgi:hypothetical protein
MKSPGSVVQVGRVAFELSRFEVMGDCCQVEGRWFGVRGRRFMRPALTVLVDEQPIRLLADLADKPWAAEDGELWKATFPYTLERPHSPEAELTVAPDLTITLPLPEFERPDRPRRRTRSPAGREPDEADALMRELVDLRDTQGRLRLRLDHTEAEKAKTAERLDDVSRELREVRAQREESNAARDRLAAELEAVRRERGEFVAERDTALQERNQMAVDRETTQRTHDQALQASEAAGVARDRALSERGVALSAQRQAASERDVASAARDKALVEREAALSLRDRALAERDEAMAARDEAVSTGEELSRTSERLDSELADLHSARGAALVMGRAAHAPVVSRRYANIFLATITIAVLLAIVLILLVLLRAV